MGAMELQDLPTFDRFSLTEYVGGIHTHPAALGELNERPIYLAPSL